MLVLLPDLMGVVFEYLKSEEIDLCLKSNAFTQDEWFSVLSKTKKCILLNEDTTDLELQNYQTSRFLSVAGCQRITGCGFQNFKGLHTLMLSFCRLVTDGALADLKHLHIIWVFEGVLKLPTPGFHT